MKVDLVKISSTFLGIGYLPFCPGTWASLASLGIYFLLGKHLAIYIIVTVVVFVIGLLICKKAEQRFGKRDSSFIVIDEVAAALILFIFVPKDIFLLILAFLIFRAIDILKPYPIKKIENLSGSWSIMGDDLLASIYTIVFIRLADILLLGGSGG